MQYNHVITLSGTHGTGKSTIMKEVGAKGFWITTESLPRAAQKKLGWENLKRVEESTQNVWDLQHAVIDSMYERNTRINKGGQVTLCERGVADVWAYTLLWCKKLNIKLDTKPVHEYYQKCLKVALTEAAQIFIPISDTVKFVGEERRADEESRLEVQRNIVSFLLDDKYTRLNYTFLDTNFEPGVKARQVSEIVHNIEAGFWLRRNCGLQQQD